MKLPLIRWPRITLPRPTPDDLAALLLVVAFALLVYGVHLLAGLGWALIAAGLLLAVLAIAIFRGGRNG